MPTSITGLADLLECLPHCGKLCCHSLSLQLASNAIKQLAICLNDIVQLSAADDATSCIALRCANKLCNTQACSIAHVTITASACTMARVANLLVVLESNLVETRTNHEPSQQASDHSSSTSQVVQQVRQQNRPALCSP